MTFIFPVYKTLNSITEALRPSARLGSGSKSDRISRDFQLNFHTHNVAGPMVQLKTVLGSDSMTDKLKQSISSFQEVHEDCLKDLISKLAPGMAFDINNVGVFINPDLTLIWAKDFTLKEKALFKFDGLARQGEHFMLTVIPREIDGLRLDLDYKLKDKKGEAQFSPKIKIYDSFHKIPLQGFITKGLFGCSDRENIALVSKINVFNQDGEKINQIKHVNMHTPAFNFGWQRFLDFTKFLDKLLGKQFADDGLQKNTAVITGDMNNIFPGEEKNLYKLLKEHGFKTAFPFNEATYGSDKDGNSVYSHDLIAVGMAHREPSESLSRLSPDLIEYEVGPKETASDHRYVRAKISFPKLC